MSDRAGAARPIPLILILLLAAGLRVVSITIPRGDFLANDGWDYRDVSRNLVEGKGFARSVYRTWFEPQPPGGAGLHTDLHRPPLLSLLGAPLWHLPGRWESWAMGASVLLGVLTVAGVYSVSSPLFGARTARLGALLFAIYPYAIHRASRWSTETLMACCLLAGIACAVRYRLGGRLRWLAAAGAMLGLTTLARPNGLILAGALAGWLLFSRHPVAKPRALAAYLVALAVVLAPWAIRNARLTGTPNPATFFGPYNMWRGTNDVVYESYRMPSRERRSELETILNRESHTHVDTLAARGLYDIGGMNGYWLDTVRDYATARPGRVAFIYAARALHVVRPWLDRDPRTRPVFFTIALAGFVPVMLLAIYALARVPQARDPMILLPMCAGALGSIPFTFVTRLRFPFYDPFLVVLAAAGAGGAYSAWRSRSHGQARSTRTQDPVTRDRTRASS